MAAAAVARLPRRARRRRESLATRRRATDQVVSKQSLVEKVSSSVPEDKLDYIRGLFKKLLRTKSPEKLDTFLAVLQGSGYTILGKDDRKLIGGDLHPFILPLGLSKNLDDDLEVIGLLIRAPNGAHLEAAAFHVVSQKPRKCKQVKLVAMDMEKYIIRRAEEAHFRNDKMDATVIEVTRDVYDVKFDGKDQNALYKWLLLEVGGFPDVYKELSLGHADREDFDSGLVIADTMRDTFGQSWGFPHSFVCNFMRKHFTGPDVELDRSMEADHSAQRCFTAGVPLWSLEEEGDRLEDLLLEAKMPKLGSLDDLRVFYLKRAVDDQRVAVRTGNISLGCAAMAKAQALMDAVCCGHKSYSSCRQELFDIYDEVPGTEALTNVIEYYM